MTDINYAHINDRFALGYDKLQWVLRRKTVNKNTGEDNWSAVAFIRSNKYQLFAHMMRLGITKDEALDVCEKLPITFTEFLAEVNDIEAGEPT